MLRPSLFLLFTLVACAAIAQNIDSGLIHYYPFDGHSNDSTSNGNHLENFGPSDTTDRFGNQNHAYHFSQGQYLSGSADSLPKGNAERTVSFWINLDFNPDHDVITCWGNQAVGGGYGIAIGNDFFGSGKSIRHFGWGDDETFGYNYPVNTWFHLLSTYDGDTAKVYVDGSLVNTSARNWSTNSSAFYVGQNINKMATDYFNGSLDELRFYNRVLSQSEIELLAEKTVGIQDDLIHQTFSLYPNPAQSYILIKGVDVDLVTIHNQLAQLVAKESPYQSQINISQLPDGIYTVRVHTIQNQTLLKKLVIQR